MKIENLVNNNGNYAPNQFVIKADGGDKIFFQSYESMVALYDRKNRKLYVSRFWDYSNTTRKHFYIFLNDYTNVRGNRKDVLEGLRDGTITMVSEESLALS